MEGRNLKCKFRVDATIISISKPEESVITCCEEFLPDNNNNVRTMDDGKQNIEITMHLLTVCQIERDRERASRPQEGSR